MALCRYCGQEAGWFCDAHKSCIQKSSQASQAVETIKLIVSNAVAHGLKSDELKAAAEAIADEFHVSREQVFEAINQGWSNEQRPEAKAQPISNEEGLAARAGR